MVNINNMRGGNWPNATKPWHIKCDRSSPLGNPYALNRTCSRDQSCNKYFDRFVDIINGDWPDKAEAQAVLDELDRILEIYHLFGEIELYCWCAPLRCHASTIQGWLEKQA